MTDSAPTTAAWVALWGKWGEDHLELGADEPFHPLVCHMLDVAAVTEALWRLALPRAARTSISGALGMADDDARAWCAYLAALHDLGKASPAFQRKKRQAVEPMHRLGLEMPTIVQSNHKPAAHGVITAWALPPILEQQGVPVRLAVTLATALGGHHGTFPPPGSEPTKVDRGGAAWDAARLGLGQCLAQSTRADRARPPSRVDFGTAMYLAGLVSVADWIGSDEARFPYEGTVELMALPMLDVESYARHAEQQATETLRRLNWTCPPAQPAATYTDLFHQSPRPLQDAAVAVAEEVQGPGIVVVEAPMGEGKTEAALYLADRWGARLGTRGAYVALPTQATSNQMFGRVQRFLAERFTGEGVDLQLLHGHAALSADFRELRNAFDSLSVRSDDEDPHSGGGVPPSVVASEWFTYRKRGLLGPFGVGTVDQVLLAVLQTRHVFVRLFGLGHKVVVVDEVHAYDTYMGTLLARLMGWLGSLGAPVILLSATLPAARRQALLIAYAQGAGLPPPPPSREAYPRLTFGSQAGWIALNVAASAATSRAIRLRHLPLNPGGSAPDAATLARLLDEALAAGGCAAVICNTVGRAQEVYRALQARFGGMASDGQPSLDLFHAAFPLEDRHRREVRSLRRFGPPGTVERPHRAVLVATQVVEQSLDLDFDLLVTDLAPVDLVLQRAGRLQRHVRLDRPPTLQGPILWILEPQEDGDGVPAFPGGSEAVYARHILLRSWLELRGLAAVEVPNDLDPLVGAVYDDRPPPAGLSPALQACWTASLATLRQDQAADESQAKRRWLRMPNQVQDLCDLLEHPREEDAPELHPIHQALTRLAEPSVNVVCLYATGDGPALDRAGRERVDLSRPPSLAEATRLLGRSVSLSNQRVVHALLEQAVPAGWARSPLLCRYRALILEPVAGGSACADAGNGWLVHLDHDVGIWIGKGDPAQAPV